MPLASDPLAVGSLVQLRIKDQWWPSRLEDVSDPDGLVVAWPTDSARALVPLEPGCPVEVLRIARGDGIYAVSGTVEECRRHTVPLLRISLEGTWHRAQRRGAFRATVAIRPRVASLHGSPLRLGITNVSATGVQLRSQDDLRRGDLLQLAFSLGDEEVEVDARVTRVSRLERVWDAGCVFEGVSERLSERIVHFIFEQQRLTLRARRENR
jgi:c-di-GMP-binding flagellar brake protein YcgR